MSVNEIATFCFATCLSRAMLPSVARLAALLVPVWRPLRRGGPQGRARPPCSVPQLLWDCWDDLGGGSFAPAPSLPSFFVSFRSAICFAPCALSVPSGSSCGKIRVYSCPLVVEITWLAQRFCHPLLSFVRFCKTPPRGSPVPPRFKIQIPVHFGGF
jgi:hypothetical protein